MKSRQELYQNHHLYPKHAFLDHEIADRMVSYLDDLIENKEGLKTIGLINLKDDYLLKLISTSFPQAVVSEVVENKEYDCVLSNLHLHNAQNIETEILAYKKYLAPNGLLFFSTFGMDSFLNLITENGPHFNILPEIRALGNYLHSLGFLDTVLHREQITLTYQSFETLFKDIRVLGNYPKAPIFKGLRTPKWLNEWKKMIQQTEDIEVVVEVLYGFTKNTPLKSVQLNENNEARFNIADIKKV